MKTSHLIPALLAGAAIAAAPAYADGSHGGHGPNSHANEHATQHADKRSEHAEKRSEHAARRHDHPARSHKCRPHRVGYVARGTVVSQELTQTAGADTAKARDDRYSGTVTVDVTRASHHAEKGEQTITVTDGRVRFYDADDDGTADTPQAGDRVTVIGRVTRLARRCDDTDFTAEVTVRRVHFHPSRHAAQDDAQEDGAQG